MTHCQVVTCPPNFEDTLSSGNLSGYPFSNAKFLAEKWSRKDLITKSKRPVSGNLP